VPDRRRPVAHTEHANAITTLFEQFPYSSCVLLVAQWSAFGDAVAAPDESSSSRITELLAGWDGILLVVPDLRDVSVTRILQSRLAPRMSVILESELQTLRFQIELQRVVTSARMLPPIRTPQHPELAHRIAMLPASWQPHLHDALRSPDSWNIKRLHRACGVDRRTLERRFWRAGLPSPAVVLGMPRRAANLPQAAT